MTSILIKIAVNAVALWVASKIVSGISFAASGGQHLSQTGVWGTIIVVAAIFGLINALIKPIVSMLSLPVTVITLGLFTFIINALMLELTAWVAGKANLAFSVEHFWPSAVLGAVVISIVSLILHVVLPDGRD